MKYIDNFLNGVTMYKLVLYGLMALASISIVLGFAGIVEYGGLQLIFSLLVLVVVCYVSNLALSTILNVQTNVESYFITGLILFFVLAPIATPQNFWMYVAIGFMAMASKYVLTIHKKHIFNPVAIALVIASLLGSGLAFWWVGSLAMLAPVSVLGFLVLRKVKRFQMFALFVTVSTVTALLWSMRSGIGVGEVLSQLFVSGPLVFFGAIMLTEPLTTPPQKNYQLTYAGIAGVLYSTPFGLGILYSSPALALVIANIYSYLVSPRIRLVLELKEKNKLSDDVYEFVWNMPDISNNRLSFKPGQYLEWTLGHNNPDIRGNRRYFTIASSPTEDGIRLGVKFYPNSSTFKKKLISLEKGDMMTASQLSGDFILPEDKSKKLVFIAGGIGVTPFRAMVKNMLDKNEGRNAVFFFSNKTARDVVYKDLFDEAERSFGLKTIYVLNDGTNSASIPDAKIGMINSEMIVKEVPDFKERIFYISGTHGMVTAFEDQLKKLGVPRSQIKIDFFPGFV